MFLSEILIELYDTLSPKVNKLFCSLKSYPQRQLLKRRELDIKDSKLVWEVILV